MSVIQARNVSGYWLRVPDSTVNSHAWDYPVTLTGAVYFNWLDPDPTANTDSRNKLQLALNAAYTRAGASSLGQLYITPGDFKVISTKPLYVRNVSITGLSGHKLWNSLPDNYIWNSGDYSTVGNQYTASNLIDYTGAPVSWSSTSLNYMPWNGKTEMFVGCTGINETTRCRIENLVVDFGWGTSGVPGTVHNITRINDTTRAEFCYYQGFGGSYHTDFVGCSFKNAPGAFIESGDDCSATSCILEEYGDHAYYFGGSTKLDFENNTLIGTRAKTGTITGDIPGSGYIGLTQREALKFRGCYQGITIRNNVADIPNARFVHMESNYISTIQIGPCGGADANNPALIVGNRVNCDKFFSYCVDRRGSMTHDQDDGPFYVQNVEITDNSIRVASSLIYEGAIWYGGLRNVLFARNGIETSWDASHTYRNRVTVVLWSNPDLDYHTEGGDYPISGLKVLDNNVLGGVNFTLCGAIGKFHIAYNTFDAASSSYSTSSNLISFASLSVRTFPDGETGFLPPDWEGISVCNNVLKNYYAYVVQGGTGAVKSWDTGSTFGYDAWTGYGESTPRISRSLVYDANGSATKLYVNSADRVTADGRPSADTAHWTLWNPVDCPFYYKNNAIYNNESLGGPDFYMWTPLSVNFLYEATNNKVYYLSSGLENTGATHAKSGAVSASLDDSTYGITSTGSSALRPDQITNFPYGN